MSTGQNAIGRGCAARIAWGRQLRIICRHGAGTDAAPYTAPTSAPAIAPFVSVSPPAHRGHDRVLHARRVEQLVERVLQGDQDPSLGSPSQTGGPPGPRRGASTRRGSAPAARAQSRAASKAARAPVALDAPRVGWPPRMPPSRRRTRDGDASGAVRPRERRRLLERRGVREQAQGADAHQRSVRLAARVRPVRRALRTRCAPMSNGPLSRQARSAARAPPARSGRRRGSRGPAPAPAPSRRSAGRPGCPSGRRPRGDADPPGSAGPPRRADRNSTRPPRLSPATWPSRQPCARASSAASATAWPRRSRANATRSPPCRSGSPNARASRAATAGAAPKARTHLLRAVGRVADLAAVLVDQPAARPRATGPARPRSPRPRERRARSRPPPLPAATRARRWAMLGTRAVARGSDAAEVRLGVAVAVR